MTVWYLCSEKKPKFTEKVLAYDEQDDEMFVCIFTRSADGGSYYSICDRSWGLWFPTHWCKLPTKPGKK